jgi:putative ABC transport system permease protein
MGVIGFTFGAVAVNLVKNYFPRRVLLLPEDAVMLGIVVLCVVASGLGVRMALKVEPAAALGG